MNYDYGREQLSAAVTILAGSGTQRDRLARALSSCLNCIIAERHLPSELRTEFCELMEAMTSRPASEPGQCRAHATVRTARPADVRAAVATVLSLYERICRSMN